MSKGTTDAGRDVVQGPAVGIGDPLALSQDRLDAIRDLLENDPSMYYQALVSLSQDSGRSIDDIGQWLEQHYATEDVAVPRRAVLEQRAAARSEAFGLGGRPILHLRVIDGGRK